VLFSGIADGVSVAIRAAVAVLSDPLLTIENHVELVASAAVEEYVEQRMSAEFQICIPTDSVDSRDAR
jgi:hypothetical protein